MSNKIMIIDGSNAILRAHAVDPSLGPNGNPIGALSGFFKILQKMVKDFTPDKIFIAWDGKGSSIRRRSINPNYKLGRKPISLNRPFGSLTEEEERENYRWQYRRVVEYLNELPVAQILLEFIEADDIISVLCREFKDDKKIIISSDKDFFQLLDENTVIYRACVKKTVDIDMVIKEFDIHPTNFALARSIAGDASDNLPGAKGVGLKTISTKFPQMKEDKTVFLSDIISDCNNVVKALKVHQSIIDSEKLIKENYDIMQLYAPSLSVECRTKIREVVDNYPNSLNKTKLRVMMTQDGTGNYSWTDLFANLNKISITNKQKG